MNGSELASHIEREYKRKKFYEDKIKSKKKDDELLEKMVEDFVEDMSVEFCRKQNSTKLFAIKFNWKNIDNAINFVYYNCSR